MVTKSEFAQAALKRIEQAAKASGSELSGFMLTAVYAELKTMYDLGVRSADQINSELRRVDV